MSKQLSPIKAFDKVLEIICTLRHDDNLQNYIDIVVAALKDYEKKTKLAKEYKDVNNVAKRLKAFEIIKEKVQFEFLEEQKEGKIIQRYFVIGNRIFSVTQKEFDLLKEILCE